MSNIAKGSAEKSIFTKDEAEMIEKYKKSLKQCDMDKPYIFISYSKKDSLCVYPLVSQLQNQGYNVWIDTRGLETSVGQNWQDPALKSIANSLCRSVFFMVSANSLKSAPVFAEIMWSQDGRAVRRSHGGKNVTLKIVDSDAEYNLADGKIRDTVNNLISKDKTKLINPTDYDTMKYVQVISSDLYEGVNKVTTKGDLAFEFYDCLFEQKLGGGGNVTLANYKDIDTIIKNIPSECKCIDNSDAENMSEPTELSAQVEKDSASTEIPSPVLPDQDKQSSGNEKNKTRSSTSTGDITYTIYGKEYTDNQANMMLNVFAKVLNNHPDVVAELLADPENSLIRCVSGINYELPENKSSSTPTRYNSGRYFNIGQGIFVGTALNFTEKLRNISQLLTICGEDFSILQSEQIELPGSIKTRSSGSGNEVYSIYGEERSGNQTQMMIDTLKFIIEKHFDKREELAKLLAIKLSPMSSLANISYFRTGDEFSCNGVIYSIGASFGRQDKLKQIAKAINICGEDISQFKINGLNDVKTPVKRSFVED